MNEENALKRKALAKRQERAAKKKARNSDSYSDDSSSEYDEEDDVFNKLAVGMKANLVSAKNYFKGGKKESVSELNKRGNQEYLGEEMGHYQTRQNMSLKELVDDESGVIEVIDFSLPSNNVGESASTSYNSTKTQPNLQVNSLKNQ